MSIDYYIDEKEGIIYEKLMGYISVDEMIAHTERQLKDTLIKPGMPTVADLNETSGEWSYLEMKRFSNYVKEKIPVTGTVFKWAVVCDVAKTNFVAKLLDIMSEATGVPLKIRIFKTQEEALNWVREK